MVYTPFPNQLGTANNLDELLDSSPQELSPGELEALAEQIRQTYQIRGDQAEILPKETPHQEEQILPNPLIEADSEAIKEDPLRYKYDYFEIHFKKRNKDGKDTELVYCFALLPAIENVFRASGQNVPDVNPGIKIQTEMNYQRHLVPGAPPVYQSLGTKGKYLLLVGTFIGNEMIKYSLNRMRPNPAILDMKWYRSFDLPEAEWLVTPRLDEDTSKINSYTKAKSFCEEVIQSGRPVLIRIRAASDNTDQDITIEIRGVVEAMRVYCVRADRTYYAITISCLDFKWYRGKEKTGDSDELAIQEKIDKLWKEVEEYNKKIGELNKISDRNPQQQEELKRLIKERNELYKRLEDLGVDVANPPYNNRNPNKDTNRSGEKPGSGSTKTPTRRDDPDTQARLNDLNRMINNKKEIIRELERQRDEVQRRMDAISGNTGILIGPDVRRLLERRNRLNTALRRARSELRSLEAERGNLRRNTN